MFVFQMSTISSNSQLTVEQLIEKRRAALLQRTNAARVQLDAVCSPDSSYRTCHEHLRRWRSQMLEQIHRARQTSLAELDLIYERLDRMRSTMINTNDESAGAFDVLSALDVLRRAEFTFDTDRVDRLDGQLELLKLSNPHCSRRLLNKSETMCRFLVARDRPIADVLLDGDLLTRVDCRTPECVLVCPFDLLLEFIADDNEVRLLVDQRCVPSIRTQTQRLLVQHDLVLLHIAQESCPQSTERVIRLVCHKATNIVACVEDIDAICNRQGTRHTRRIVVEHRSRLEATTPSLVYTPDNYNRSKIHLYGGYADTTALVLSTGNGTASHSLFPVDTSQAPATPIPSPCLPASSPTSPSQQHFDRVLMPVSIRQALPITDMQAGALLGPKGERIQQLQRETGAIVNIGDLNDESNERRKRIVHIQGSEQQVNSALQVIRKLLMIDNEQDNVDRRQSHDDPTKHRTMNN
jgi:hypothetical protein